MQLVPAAAIDHGESDDLSSNRRASVREPGARGALRQTPRPRAQVKKNEKTQQKEKQQHNKIKTNKTTNTT